MSPIETKRTAAIKVGRCVEIVLKARLYQPLQRIFLQNGQKVKLQVQI